MDALILSCGTGGGHNAAARAVTQALQSGGHRAVMLNPYRLCSEKLAARINHIYIGMAQQAPRSFGLLYQAGQLYRRLPFRSPVYFANRGAAAALQTYLAQNPVDIIITTHLFPAEIFTYMKLHHMPLPKTVFIATDYACIPFTEETLCDAYVIPSAALCGEFSRRGIPQEKLYPLGIPVESAFTAAQTRAQARARLGLAADKKYILVTGGSMGGGSIEKAIKRLLSAVQGSADTELIIICGSNKKLYNKLCAQGAENAQVLGYTGDMAAYMRACDLFITKPGGLSSTEAALSGIPIVHTGAIPGCETYNAAYFYRCGMSRYCSVKSDFSEALALLRDSAARDAMLDKQRKNMPQNSAAEIVAFAQRLVSAK